MQTAWENTKGNDNDNYSNNNNFQTLPATTPRALKNMSLTSPREKKRWPTGLSTDIAIARLKNLSLQTRIFQGSFQSWPPPQRLRLKPKFTDSSRHLLLTLSVKWLCAKGGEIQPSAHTQLCRPIFHVAKILLMRQMWGYRGLWDSVNSSFGLSGLRYLCAVPRSSSLLYRRREEA